MPQDSFRNTKNYEMRYNAVELSRVCETENAVFLLNVAGAKTSVEHLAEDGFSMKVTVRARYFDYSKVTFYKDGSVFSFRIKQNLSKTSLPNILSMLSCRSIKNCSGVQSVTVPVTPMISREVEQPLSSSPPSLSGYTELELLEELSSRINVSTTKRPTVKPVDDMTNVVKLAERSRLLADRINAALNTEVVADYDVA